jgi:hypothetical protein
MVNQTSQIGLRVVMKTGQQKAEQRADRSDREVHLFCVGEEEMLHGVTLRLSLQKPEWGLRPYECLLK